MEPAGERERRGRVRRDAAAEARLPRREARRGEREEEGMF